MQRTLRPVGKRVGAAAVGHVVAGVDQRLGKKKTKKYKSSLNSHSTGVEAAGADGFVSPSKPRTIQSSRSCATNILALPNAAKADTST